MKGYDLHMTISRTTPAHNPRTRAIPIYLRGTSKPIGRVIGGTFEKVIQGRKHLLRTPPALGFDLSTLEDAERAGATHVAVPDSETGRVYRAAIADVRRNGFDVVRGYGRQIALPLSAYSVDGQPPAVRPGQPATNQERKELQLGLFGGVA